MFGIWAQSPSGGFRVCFLFVLFHSALDGGASRLVFTLNRSMYLYIGIGVGVGVGLGVEVLLAFCWRFVDPFVPAKLLFLTRSIV